MKKKTIALILSCVLVLGCAIGGTIAWLTDKTAAIANTFTVGNVDIELTETTGENYKMVPGTTITKDPTVTVKDGSEACWLFVKVEKSTNASFDEFMNYDMAEGWTALTGVDGVFYRDVPSNAAVRSFSVLKDNTVTVKSDVTKEEMDALNDATRPTLTFTAYAVQQQGFTDVATAWEEASK